MITVDGYNVYPSKVEAMVVLKAGQAAIPEELQSRCEGRLEESKRPRTIEIRDSVPNSSLGKVLYEFRAEAAAQHV